MMHTWTEQVCVTRTIMFKSECWIFIEQGSSVGHCLRLCLFLDIFKPQTVLLLTAPKAIFLLQFLFVVLGVFFRSFFSFWSMFSLVWLVSCF